MKRLDNLCYQHNQRKWSCKQENSVKRLLGRAFFVLRGLWIIQFRCRHPFVAARNVGNREDHGAQLILGRPLLESLALFTTLAGQRGQEATNKKSS